MVASIKPESTTSQFAPADEAPRILDHFRTFVATISAPRARQITQDLNWSRQRALNERWVEILRMAILKRELTFLSLVYAEFPSGRQVLIDGQHRLAALGRIEGFILPAQVTVHRVNDEDEVGALYLTYDRSRTRTPEVGLRALGIFDETKTPEQFVRRMASGALIVNSGFNRSGRLRGDSLIERSRIVESWLPEIGRYHDTLSAASRETTHKLVRAAVGAVALATLREQPDQAEAFWSRVASQEMLTNDDPRYVLMQWLRGNVSAQSRGRQGMPEITYCLYVAGAWNAFFEDRRLKILKVSDPSAPVRLSGTSYRGAPA